MAAIPPRNLQNLDLNLIRPLAALLDSGSVSQAAVVLGMTQPGMSKALSRLRQCLNDPLLVRVGTHMELTEQARTLRPVVRNAVGQLDLVFAAKRNFEPTRLSRTYYISTPDYGEGLIAPTLFQRLRQQAPGVDLRLTPPTHSDRSKLADGTLDAILAPPTQQDTNLKMRKLFRETFCCLVRRDHPRVSGALDLDLFCELEHLLIMVDPDGPVSGPVDERLAELGRSRRIGMTVNGFMSVAPILANTELVGTVPLRTAQLAQKLFPLKHLEHPLGRWGFDLCLLWHPRRDEDPDHVWFRSVLIESCSALCAS